MTKRWFSSLIPPHRFAFAFTAVCVAVCIAYLCGARINHTRSLPLGLYWVVNKQPERGDYVSFRPCDNAAMKMALERGYVIPGPYNGYGPMLKILMGLPGDTVSIRQDGIVINGKFIPNSKPLDADNMGNPLPVFRLDNYTLQNGEVLLLSDHMIRSFDSRYFGIQNMDQIIAVLTPVIVW